MQEIIDLTVGDIRLESPAIIRLMGKGRKRRTVPLMSQTAQLLKNYLDEQKLMGNDPLHPVFFNKQRQKLSRKGVTYIIEKYVRQAAEVTPMPTFNITPHVFRHPYVKLKTKNNCKTTITSMRFHACNCCLYIREKGSKQKQH